MNCLFCCDLDTDDKPEKKKNLICPLCDQLLLSAGQEDLRRAYGKALELGYDRKAKAIESFIIEGETSNERKTKTIRRNLVRKRPLRTVRPTRNQFRPQQATVELD